MPNGNPVPKNISVDTPVIPPPVIFAGIRKAVQPSAVRNNPNVMIRWDRISPGVIFSFMPFIYFSVDSFPKVKSCSCEK
jgi:hypothetical protein